MDLWLQNLQRVIKDPGHTLRSQLHSLRFFFTWNVTLPRVWPLTLPCRILRSALLQISTSLLPWLFNSLTKLFLWVGQRENSDWSFVMRLFHSLQTLSEYFPVLAFKSLINSLLQIILHWNTVNYMDVYKGHAYRYLWRFWHSLCQSWTIRNCRSFWQLKSTHKMHF